MLSFSNVLVDFEKFLEVSLCFLVNEKYFRGFMIYSNFIKLFVVFILLL